MPKDILGNTIFEGSPTSQLAKLKKIVIVSPPETREELKAVVDDYNKKYYLLKK
ncbi:hypothetical protein [Spartinivicinus poritis]|uniref:Uncharacterized protein n=1 Tax=Spartinivicinus poritis TaxID=2994640 RepID=A0ABT5UB52_9GAMM|nr:hypothetical protein [Spartinivicinus sp. A2-2]MDE1462762.1 hypothetical protein [Spartinivicinus sp. A2-2]